MSKKIVIIGNGVAGVTAALNLRKQDPGLDISIISSESKYFYSRTALMYIFMGHMKFKDTMPYPKSFWKKQNIALIHDFVESVKPEKNSLNLRKGGKVSFDKLIIASGSKSNKFNWPGQDLLGVQGLYSLQDLELLERNIKKAKNAVIVGGGLIGIELAEMLHSRGVGVTFLVREKSYWNRILLAEESELVNEAIRKEGIDLRLSTTLKEIVDDGNGRCEAVITEEGERIDCQVVGLTVGVSPNIKFLEGSGINTNRGIVVNKYFQTNYENIFSIGDCAELPSKTDRPNLEQLWYTGKMQGLQLAKNITTGNAEYEKGIFYNSAKFINTEYQIYGEVPHPNNEDLHLLWQSDKKDKLLRLVFREYKLIGVNVLGMRYRQNVCHDWIGKGAGVDYVIENLRAANFDPEFYTKYEKQIKSQFQGEFNE